MCVLVAAVGAEREQAHVRLAELVEGQVGKLVDAQLIASVLAVVLCNEVHISAEDSKALRKLARRIGLAESVQESFECLRGVSLHTPPQPSASALLGAPLYQQKQNTHLCSSQAVAFCRLAGRLVRNHVLSRVRRTRCQTTCHACQDAHKRQSSLERHFACNMIRRLRKHTLCKHCKHADRAKPRYCCAGLAPGSFTIVHCAG